MSSINTAVRKPRPAKSKVVAASDEQALNGIPIMTTGHDIEAAIRVRAYHKWEAAGRPLGDGVNFWLEAEREVLHLA